MINAELLEYTLDYIKKNPQKWYQGSWFVILDDDGVAVPVYSVLEVEEVNSCNTAMCFAGHAALAAGFPAPPKQTNIPWQNANGEFVSDFAADALGLDYDRASVLFNGDNDLQTLEKLVEAILADPDITPEELDEIQEDALAGEEENTCNCYDCHTYRLN